jgi:MFS family permease
VTAALAGIPAGRATDRFGARRVLAAGLIEMTVGLICVAILPRSFGVAGYVAALIILTPGFQLFLAANNTAVMANAGEKQRGVLSGLLGLSRNLGFMTGASVMTTFFAVSVGTKEITEASARAIADGFTATFLVAAGMTLLALVLAFVGRPEARAERS